MTDLNDPVPQDCPLCAGFSAPCGNSNCPQRKDDLPSGEFNRFRVLCAVTAERICREHADPKTGYAVASAIRALPLPSADQAGSK